MRFLSSLEMDVAKLLAQASGLPVRQLPAQWRSEQEMQMLMLARRMVSSMQLATEKKSVSESEKGTDLA